jgi:catechol 2,3-dioxygenase-like lactoylglutathione lyase family enzyme
LGDLVGKLHRALGGWLPEEIDLGGGYSFAGDPTGRAIRRELTPATPAEYAEAIGAGLAEGLTAAGIDPAGMALEIEPGRAIYGSAGLHLSRVLNVKHQSAPVPRTWVGCDSSEVLLSDTTWENSRWEPVPVDPIAGDPVDVDVVGVSCGFDTIAASTPLPSGVAAGVLLAFLATGAYEETLAGNFNSIPRPASVLVSGADAAVIRRAETLADVLDRDRVPGAARPRVLGVDHVAVVVADLDRSLEFYSGLLGLTVRDRGAVDPGLVERMTGLPDAEVEFADVELGGRTLELLQYHAPHQRGGPPARPERPGSLHIALEVEDAAAVHGRLVGAGLAPLSAPQKLEDDGSDWAGCLVFYVRDPDGALLEIVQRPPVAGRVVTPAAVSYRP